MFKKIFILPTGSYEYHGRELPPDTDSVIANNIAKDLVEILESRLSKQIILLPSLNFGLSFEHKGFPKTAYTSHNAFYTFTLELFNSIAEDDSVLIIINGHGGNIHTLTSLEADFNYSHNTCKLIFPLIYPQEIRELCVKLFGEFDSHAGSVEASLLALYQGQRPKEYAVPILKKFSGSLRFFKTKDLYPDGVVKELSVVIADPEKRRILHGAILDHLITYLSDLLANIEKCVGGT